MSGAYYLGLNLAWAEISPLFVQIPVLITFCANSREPSIFSELLSLFFPSSSLLPSLPPLPFLQAAVSLPHWGWRHQRQAGEELSCVGTRAKMDGWFG